MSFFNRFISWFWPLEVQRSEGLSGLLVVRWEQGRKVLNSANGNQSFGSLHTVWQRTLRRLDLGRTKPRSVLLLGLGGGSVPRILRNELHVPAKITAVEFDPGMIAMARAHFDLDRITDLELVTGDATIQVHALKDRYDLVLVDLFQDLDLAHGVDSRSFMHGLRDRCAEDGLVCFNTVGYDATSDARCDAVQSHAGRIFNSVQELRLEGVNRMFIIR